MCRNLLPPFCQLNDITFYVQSLCNCFCLSLSLLLLFVRGSADNLLPARTGTHCLGLSLLAKKLEKDILKVIRRQERISTHSKPNTQSNIQKNVDASYVCVLEFFVWFFVCFEIDRTTFGPILDFFVVLRLSLKLIK